MICTGCDNKFDFNQGRFVETERIQGFTGKCYDWYCGSCTPTVAIDDTTKKTPEPTIPPARVDTAPERELPPVEAYATDENTPFNDPIPF
jgi:hypothetical protein